MSMRRATATVISKEEAIERVGETGRKNSLAEARKSVIELFVPSDSALYGSLSTFESSMVDVNTQIARHEDTKRVSDFILAKVRGDEGTTLYLKPVHGVVSLLDEYAKANAPDMHIDLEKIRMDIAVDIQDAGALNEDGLPKKGKGR